MGVPLASNDKQVMDIQGKVLEVCAPETRQFKAKDTGEEVQYTSRTVIIDNSRYSPATGDRIENLLPVVFSGRYLDQLNSLQVGAEVKVTIYPKGWRSQRDDGSAFYGVTLRGFEVSTMAPAAPTATPARHG